MAFEIEFHVLYTLYLKLVKQLRQLYLYWLSEPNTFDIIDVRNRNILISKGIGKSQDFIFVSSTPGEREMFIFPSGRFY